MLNELTRPDAPSDTPDPLIRADRHPLDDLIEAALDEWHGSPVDQRTEGAVVRSVLANPAHAALVSSWLTEAGIVVQVEAPTGYGPAGCSAPVWLFPSGAVEAAPEWMAAERGAVALYRIGGVS